MCSSRPVIGIDSRAIITFEGDLMMNCSLMFKTGLLIGVDFSTESARANFNVMLISAHKNSPLLDQLVTGFLLFLLCGLLA